MSKVNFSNSHFSNDMELFNKLVSLRRVVKVVKGGRRFAFSAFVIVGDRAGRVGFGIGKSREVSEAIAKAIYDSNKNVIRVPLKDGRTLHHDITIKYCATKAIFRSSPPGCGIIAGGAARSVFELLGVKDVVAKFIGSRQSHNVVRAAFKALSMIHNPRIIADKRGKKISEIVRRRIVSHGNVDKHNEENAYIE